MKNVTINTNGYIHMYRASNGIRIQAPANGGNEERVFEKTGEEDTTYIDRAEAHYNQAIADHQQKIADGTAQADAFFADLRNPEPEEE